MESRYYPGPLPVASMLTFPLILIVMGNSSRSYFRAIIVANAGWAGFCAQIVVWHFVVLRTTATYLNTSFEAWHQVLSSAIWAVITSAVSAGVLAVRIRWLPVYGDGRCRRCGYLLRGLPTSRCPECGTDAADSSAADEEVKL